MEHQGFFVLRLGYYRWRSGEGISVPSILGRLGYTGSHPAMEGLVSLSKLGVLVLGGSTYMTEVVVASLDTR